MEFFNVLNEKMKEAMKNKNASELKTLRLIKAELMKAEKDGVELNDLTIFKILTKMVSQREESYKQYVEGNREDLAIVEKEEMDVIKTFIPKQPSDEEIIDIPNGEVVDEPNTEPVDEPVDNGLSKQEQEFSNKYQNAYQLWKTNTVLQEQINIDDYEIDELVDAIRGKLNGEIKRIKN